MDSWELEMDVPRKTAVASVLYTLYTTTRGNQGIDGRTNFTPLRQSCTDVPVWGQSTVWTEARGWMDGPSPRPSAHLSM